MLFRREQFDSDLREELRLHRELREQDEIDRGLSPEDAHYAAQQRFGNDLLLREESRDLWRWNWVENLFHDVRFGLRQLGRNPGFTSVVALSLALGIGVNTAIFSLINAVMLRTLPVKAPERLVFLDRAGRVGEDLEAVSSDNGSENESPFSYPAYEEFRAHADAFSSLFGFVSLGKSHMNIDGQASLADGELVTGDYFPGLGVSPVLGRTITREDAKPGAPRAAVISYNYWVRQFGRNPAVVGKGVMVDGVSFTIVGVTPPEFFGLQPGRSVDVWVPLVEETRLLPYGMSSTPGGRALFTSRDWWWLIIAGRLRPGVTAQQATAQLDVLFRQSVTAGRKVALDPKDNLHIRLQPAARGLAILRQQFSKPLWILMIIVGVVLLIACANVATLLVARATVRQKEIAVGLSMGALRARLVRQLLTESVLLAGFGGLLGLLFAFWGSHTLALLMSEGSHPLELNVQPDARVLAFTAAVSVLTGILFGLAPALRATRVDLTPALKSSAGAISALGQRARWGLGKSLVVAQVALSLPLLMGAGLFVQTLGNLQSRNLGFDQHRLLLFGIDPSKDGYQGERLHDFCGQLLARLQALPGVRSATVSEVTLVSGTQDQMPIAVEGYKPKPGESMGVDWNNVGPSFFATMGIRMVLGRDIDGRDTSTAPKVAVVNEAFARRFLDGRNPLGYKIDLKNPFSEVPEKVLVYEVVGMVQDSTYASVRDESHPTVYVPFDQMPWRPWGIHYEVRTVGDPLALVPSVRQAVRALDPNLPISNVKTQTAQIAEALTDERLFAQLSSFFGGIATMLAFIGLYGLLAYAVARRTGEMGIRMALGAQRRDILRLVMGETLVIVGVGIALGVPAAFVAIRFVQSMLFGLRPTDALTASVAAAVMILVALLAGYIPARRATKVDPLVALRYE